jgi:hypothetical protein
MSWNMLHVVHSHSVGTTRPQPCICLERGGAWAGIARESGALYEYICTIIPCYSLLVVTCTVAVGTNGYYGYHDYHSHLRNAERRRANFGWRLLSDDIRETRSLYA